MSTDPTPAPRGEPAPEAAGHFPDDVLELLFHLKDVREQAAYLLRHERELLACPWTAEDLQGVQWNAEVVIRALLNKAPLEMHQAYGAGERARRKRP